MLLRFVIPDRDDRTGQQTGSMTVAYRLLHSGHLTRVDEERLRSHRQWLETNLPIPARFARKRNVSHKQTHGISWLRSSATDAVRCLRAISDIAQRHDHLVEVVHTETTGLRCP